MRLRSEKNVNIVRMITVPKVFGSRSDPIGYALKHIKTIKASKSELSSNASFLIVSVFQMVPYYYIKFRQAFISSENHSAFNINTKKWLLLCCTMVHILSYV